ncbi:MAG: imidazoleglycerol-phosphate dehydratase/histidinol-phosphatase [Saprospiraceae bacterium]|jgi:imidazoleglycerol-phosphate dehydratase/histidinol-phosphatase
MKKVLFIDRDGTLIIEPPTDYQVDSFEKLEYYPSVFQYLAKIASELDYELVMITNQDGLGTASFPETDFWPVHNKMIEAFKNEGIEFANVYIDKSFSEDNLATRKPGTAMLTQYLEGNYDLENSFVLGDRLSDIQLAANLGAKGILMMEEKLAKVTESLQPTCSLITPDWSAIYAFLKFKNRSATVRRTTSETDISIELLLDGTGQSRISTGLGFFDHMLEQIAKHSGADLIIEVKGDLHIDEHHTIEDTALALGEAFAQTLGNKESIERYGFCLPMDDCLSQVAIDFGGRPWLVWEADFKREKIGDMPTEMFLHFFKSFSDAAKCNLNIKVEGNNEHHKIEAIFKAFAKAIKMAIRRDTRNVKMPSTKGVI